MRLGIDEEGSSSVPSSFGALLTLLLLCLIGIYGVYKIMSVLGKQRFSLLQTVIQGRFKSTDSFTASDGFMFSYALDNEYGPTQVPPEVGSLQVAAWEWGYDENQ